MKTYAKNVENRKDLVKRLEALTGLKARYTFMPRCAYEIGAFTVEKDGTLTVQDGADLSILAALTAEGMIGAEQTEPTTEPAQTAETNIGTEEWDDDEWAEDTESDAETQAVWQPDADIFAEPDTTEETAEETNEEVDTEEVTAEPEQPEPEETTDANEPEEEPGHIDGFPMITTVSFPLGKHTVQSLTNLICMIHSRGALLSKATGGEFFADKALADAILDDRTFRSVPELISYVREWGETKQPLIGISFTDDMLTFDGFGTAPDGEHMHAFMNLAAAMNKMALTQKRVQAKDVDDSNEKYALRIWLIRLGLNGVEYKADRKLLMANLSGHSAFRNDDERERWTAKQQAKRDALKAAKAENAAAND